MLKAAGDVRDSQSYLAPFDGSYQIASEPTSLDELDHADRRNAPWLLFLDLADSNGRPDVSRLALIAEHSDARALRISE